MDRSGSAGSEFKIPDPYERYAAQRARRHTQASASAYGAASVAAGGAGLGLSGAKLAGTKTGQRVIHDLHAVAHANKHPATDRIAQAGRIGQRAAGHKVGVSAAILGASAVAGGTRVLRNFRRDETGGISSGIGRVKAGERYQHNIKQVTTSKSASIRLIAAASDVMAGERGQRVSAYALRHRKGLTRTAVATGGGLIALQGARGISHRKQQKQELAQLVNKNGDLEYRSREYPLHRAAGAGLGGAALAYGLPRSRTMSGAVGYGMAQSGRTKTVAAATQRALNASEKFTAPWGKTTRSLASQNVWGRRALALPRTTRSGALVAGGAALLHHSLPLHQDRYQRVMMPPPSYMQHSYGQPTYGSY